MAYRFSTYLVASLLVHALVLGGLVLTAGVPTSLTPFQVDARAGFAELNARFVPGVRGRQTAEHGDGNTAGSNAGQAAARAGLITRSVSELRRTIPYPALAREMNMQGRLVITCTIDARGRVSAATVSRSSGHDLLDRTALEHVRTWTFPVGEDETSFEIPVRFRLE